MRRRLPSLGRARVVLPALVTAILVWCPAASAAPRCSTAPAAGSHLVQLEVAGLRRSVLVHVPTHLATGEQVPLVLALHGVGGSGPQMERYTGFSRLADQFTFVVAYPSSDGAAWNSTGATGKPDDVAFIAHTIDELEQSSCIDPERVFAAGISNGGGMVALAGCELSAQIAAIAPVAGGYDSQPSCRPQEPLSVLEIHGTADQIVPYFGRTGRRTADGVPPFVNAWVRRDRCAPAATVRQIAARTTRYEWSGCSGGTRVEHVRILGGRHQWPGAHPPDPGPPATICTACTVWSFFSSLETSDRAFSASAGPGL